MRRMVCLTLAVILGSHSIIGCTSWHAQHLPPAEVIQQHHPSQARVRLADGRELILEQPLISGDSLVASHATQVQRTGDSLSVAPMAIPLGGINEFAIQSISASKTVGLFLGTLVGIAVIGLAIFAEECNHSSCYE